MEDGQVIELLQGVLRVAKESYKQELDRSNKLLAKSDYVIKYVTSILVFINAIMVLMMNAVIVDKLWIIGGYIVNSIILLVSLIYAVRTQNLVQVEFFPLGETLLQDLNSYYEQNNKLYTSQEMLNDEVMYYSESVKKLSEVNDARADFLKKAYYFFVGGMVAIVVTLVITLVVSNIKGGETMQTSQQQIKQQTTTSNTINITTNDASNATTTASPFRVKPLSKMRPVTEGFSMDIDNDNK